MAKTKTLAKPAAKAAPTPVVESKPEIVRESSGGLTAERTSTTSAMPPSNGEPSAQRAARILRFPDAGSPGRARMAAGLQGAVGNSRIARMMEKPETAPEVEETPAVEPEPRELTERGEEPAVEEATTETAEPTVGAGPAGAAPPAGGGGESDDAGDGDAIAARGSAGGGAAAAGPPPGEGRAEDETAAGSEVIEAPASEGGTAAGAAPPPAAAGAAGEGPAAAAAAPAADGTAGGIFASFTRSGPSQIAAGFPSLGQRIAAGFKVDREQAAKKAPPVTARSDGGPAAAEAPPSVAEAPPPAAVPEARSEPAAHRAPRIRTAAGHTPRFQPTGEANPDRAVAVESRAAAEARAGQGQLSAEIRSNPGESRIQPRQLAAECRLEVPKTEAAPKTEGAQEMQDYLAAPFAGSLRGKADKAVAPVLEKSLAGPREKAAKAVAKRDADYEKSLQDAQAEAAAMGAEADAEQAETVRQARGEMVAEKEKGLAESRRKLDEVNADLSRRRKDKVDEINRRVETDERRADDELDKADKNAKQEKEKAAQKAREKERAAEKKKRNLPWYKKIARFFSSIANALKKAVTAIMDLAKKAVKGLIAAAQALAKGIIEGCRAFVVAAIQAYAALAKSLVTALVGTFFPELAATINAAIDRHVEKATAAVNAIADKLKKGVDALAKKLNAAVDAAFKFCEALIEGGVAMLKALLTGDFLGALKIGFLAVCKAAGLPGKQILEKLEQAGSLLLEIIKHPGTFVNNLLKAVGQGFQQFWTNIRQHLIAGLMAFLFGALASSGVERPADLSLKSIAKLLLQLLGLTVDRFREMLAKRIGEKNVERLEKAWDFLNQLLGGGLSGLTTALAAYMGNLKSMVMTAIMTFLIQRVVMAAVKKIISMFNPVSGIISILMSLWNVIRFVIEKARQIMMLAAAVFGTLAPLVQGDVKKAADQVERALAIVLPLALGFLAGLLGLGKLAGYIVNLMKKFGAYVLKIVKKVINMIVKMFRKLFGKGDRGKALKDPSLEKERQRKAMRDVISSTNSLKGPRKRFLGKERTAVTRDQVVKLLSKKKRKHGFSVLRLITPAGEQTVKIEGGFSPTESEEAKDVRITDPKDAEGYHEGTSGDPIPVKFYMWLDDYSGTITLYRKPPDEYKIEKPRDKIVVSMTEEANVYKGGSRYTLGVKSKNIPFGKIVLRKSATRGTKATEFRELLKHLECQVGGQSQLEGHQIDHVTDIALHGDDEFPNLWPLRTDINLLAVTEKTQFKMGSGWYGQYYVKYKDGDELKIRNIYSLRNKYLRLVGVARSPSEWPGESNPGGKG